MSQVTLIRQRYANTEALQVKSKGSVTMNELSRMISHYILDTGAKEICIHRYSASICICGYIHTTISLSTCHRAHSFRCTDARHADILVCRGPLVFLDHSYIFHTLYLYILCILGVGDIHGRYGVQSEAEKPHRKPTLNTLLVPRVLCTFFTTNP